MSVTLILEVIKLKMEVKLEETVSQSWAKLLRFIHNYLVGVNLTLILRTNKFNISD